MGKGGRKQLGSYSCQEVAKHDKRDDRWIIINNEVYNITEWSKRHPGGSKVIGHYAGQDATDAFRAFHNDLDQVQKYLLPLHIGSVQKGEVNKNYSLEKDFRELRETAEKMGLFKPSYWFFFIHLAHILAMEVMAYLTLYYFGTGWIPFIVSVCLYATVQSQIGWLQHDFGHLSVFKSSWLDHVFHFLTIGCIKGASPSWWNHMHYQHHAKPNVMGKDPDVRVDQLFVVGEKMPVKVAESNKSSMPYNLQHKYFFIIGPPLLFPVYFQFMLFRHIFTRRLWKDFIVVMAFYVKFFYLYTPLLGVGWVFVYYEIMRVLESHWFTWVSQSNHIPMDIDEDTAEPWIRLQLKATCDIEQSFFNDWFTGHLNFQIEHHLFPTMPRHNLYKIQPIVQSLCKKHGIPYQMKTLSQSFVDIVKSLKHSGELWEATLHAHHVS
ncbi:acyl-CoA 6-desaturase-like isoform X1 [Saccostrea echinata]|uniref:acyl-CoA 6-desaturase-like isoform X1 n=1 Tax=Saccostrea echinata TaxID=191078 RepID=UPI002A7F37A9|nr:acyl-CoA 6-desaturase-like isoform X1 [Saccostrea echinata]XP_061165494.1 acyl-CoA 6-desaturase-like isoform X1 [Saccostrea echinata]